MLWLTVTDTPLGGATVHCLDTPTDTARAIGRPCLFDRWAEPSPGRQPSASAS